MSIIKYNRRIIFIILWQYLSWLFEALAILKFIKYNRTPGIIIFTSILGEGIETTLFMRKFFSTKNPVFKRIKVKSKSRQFKMYSISNFLLIDIEKMLMDFIATKPPCNNQDCLYAVTLNYF